MGVKRVRGKGALYEERKEKKQFMLTGIAIAALDQEAARQGISRSEVVERYARSLAQIIEEVG